MGLAASTGRDNDEMVDNMVEGELIRQAEVELAFRLVDRARFFPAEERENAYKDTAWKSKTGAPGRLHISAPCIYANVVEHLRLKRGHSFLNLGSGTGYLNTVVGYLIGTNGCNHGIELHENIVAYAIDRVAETLNSDEFAAFDWCVPQFFQGNALNIDSSCYLRYDRVYCGAAVSEPYRLLLCSLLNVGGICIMPFQDQLQRITRTDEDRFEVRNITSVSFADFQIPSREEAEKEQPVVLPEIRQPTLQEVCRDQIRACIRAKALKECPLKMQRNTYTTNTDYQPPTGHISVLRLDDRSPILGSNQDLRPSINAHQRAVTPVPRNADQELEDEAPQHLMAIFGEEVETDNNGNAVVVRPQLPHLIHAMNERVRELGGLPRREERLPDGTARLRPYLPGNANEATIVFQEEFMLPVRRYDPRALRPDREERNRQLLRIRDTIRENRMGIGREHREHVEAIMRANAGRAFVPPAPRISMEQAYMLFQANPRGGRDPEEDAATPVLQIRSRRRPRRLPQADIENGLAAEDVRAHEEDLPNFPDEGPPPEEEAGENRELGSPERRELGRQTADQLIDQLTTELNRPDEIDMDNRLEALRERIRQFNRVRDEPPTTAAGSTRIPEATRTPGTTEPTAPRPTDEELRARRDELFSNLLRQRRENQRREVEFFGAMSEQMNIEEPMVRPIITSDVLSSSSSSSSTPSSSSSRSSVKRSRSTTDPVPPNKQQRRSPSSSGNEDDATITEPEAPAERGDADMDVEVDVEAGRSADSAVTSEGTSSSRSSRSGSEQEGEPAPRLRHRYYGGNAPRQGGEQEGDSSARDAAHAAQIASLRQFRKIFDKYVDEMPVLQKFRRFLKYGID